MTVQRSSAATRRQCVILAGGLAQRMRPLTETVPKTLLHVRGVPFAHYQLSWLAAQGVTDVLYCIGYLGDMVREFVRDGSPWGLRINYSDEGDMLRGTAGALRHAADQGLLDDSFCVLYGDSYLRLDIADTWLTFDRSRKPALMTVLHNDGLWDVSNVEFAGGELLLYDKKPGLHRQAMRHIDYGLSILSRESVQSMPPSPGKSDLADFFHTLSRRGELSGYLVRDRFFEIGSPQGLADLEQFLTESMDGEQDAVFSDFYSRDDRHTARN